MFFRQRPSKDATLSYFFGCAGLGKAVAVDVVAGDEDWFVEEAGRAGRAELEVYPGHQVGSACGAGLSGKPASTIGFERRFNPMLSLPKQAFVEALVAQKAPPPAAMARTVEANLRGVVPEALAG